MRVASRKSRPTVSDPSDLLDRDFWTGILDDVRGEADDWIEKYRDDLIEFGKDEAKSVFAYLARGDADGAKFEVARHMTREQWEAYRDGTTQALADEANRRVRIYKALDELGRRAAKKIGAAVLGALGI